MGQWEWDRCGPALLTAGFSLAVIVSNRDLEMGKIRCARCPWGAHCSREDSQDTNFKNQVRSLVRSRWEQMRGLVTLTQHGGWGFLKASSLPDQ